ncbi:MAG: FecR family protein, partial [Acidobacteriota bacterium]|nr:FecR family protein [Acidobacteriota bacterium]
NHELQGDERQAIGEHLLLCADCRTEHDQIKLGAALANKLERADASESVWNKIENVLDGKENTKISLIPQFSFFDSRAFAAMASLLIMSGLMAAIYFGLAGNKSPETVKNETPVPDANTEISQIVSTPNGTLANQNTSATTQTAETNSAIQIPSNTNPNNLIQPQTTNSNIKISPKVSPIQPNGTIIAQNNAVSWNIETISGTPKVGDFLEKGKLSVGQFLETDANSRARVQVANIGQVEIAPNSRVQLVGTKSTEHRLSLERGVLQAKIFAPPRLFIVDTPSAMVVDLGCEYTLEVDAAGNSKLQVTSGFVALERGGRESIVPAGAMCFTKKGKGLGTPFSVDASAGFKRAVQRFDFENGGRESLQTIIKQSNIYDALTLWHLLARVPKTEREKIFDALISFVKLPNGATREGILRLDEKMLDAWWTEIENVWFE